MSTPTQSTASSILSSLSMNDVSVLAVYALPIYSSDLANSQHYDFGDVPEQTLAFGNDNDEKPSDTASTNPSKRVSKTVKWALSMQNTHPIPGKSEVVFGVPIEVSIKYAKAAIFGKDLVHGHVPIVLERCGFFLKRKGKGP